MDIHSPRDLLFCINKQYNVESNIDIKNPNSVKKSYSICIAAYHASNFIDDCLYSIESQNYFKIHDDYEILLGIDGCKSTYEKVESIKHNYRNLRVFYNPINKGKYVTQNTLISNAIYNDVICFDADDMMCSDTMSTINLHNNNDYDIIRFKFINFIDGYTPAEIVDNDYGCGVFYVNRDKFKNVNGFSPWVCSADIDLLARMKRNNSKIKLIDEFLFMRRIHDDSLTHHTKTVWDPTGRKHSKIRQETLKKYEYNNNHNIIKIEEYSLNNDLKEMKSKNPFDFFDDIYCINVDHDLERYVKCMQQARKYGFKIKRFSAIKINGFPRSGAYGATLTHKEILKECKRRNLNNVLIFEDDFLFEFSKEKTWHILNNALAELKEDTGLLYLGSSVWKNLSKSKGFSINTIPSHDKKSNLLNIINNLTKEESGYYIAGCFAYCVFKSAFSVFDDVNENRNEINSFNDFSVCDQLTSGSLFQKAIIVPQLVNIQKENFSSIENQKTSYNDTLKRNWISAGIWWEI